MKNLWIIGIVMTWVMICIIGILSWETMIDMYQGLVLGMVISAVVYGLSNFAGRNNEYDEYGDYRVKF